jgi:putative ABC transport system substrate-binding protein
MIDLIAHPGIDPMRRRDFITLLGGVAAAPAMLWPLAARAQQGERMRRIGVLVALAADAPQSQARNAAFLQGLGELGWNVGRNLQIDYRWGGGDVGRYPGYAAELLALAPEVILAVGASIVGPLLQATRTVPVVFVQVTDPVGSGYVASLARPGGNATGFTQFEFGISAKWIELLKQIAPGVTRVAVLSDPRVPSGLGMLGAIQSVAPMLGVELTSIGMRDASEMEGAITAYARGSNDGLIVLPSAPAHVYHQQIIAQAARHKLPAVYFARYFITGGGLISYGADEFEQYRQAAGYVDRILKGEKPADLPVQAPTRYLTVLNLKTAKALGLDVPATVLTRADEVIE